MGPTGAAGEMGPQGPAGEMGPMGPAGPQGLPGESVLMTELLPGDANCPTGGASFEVGVDAGVTFACNGEVGAAGADGAVGPQGVQGPAGPAGPTGIVASTFGSGSGTNPQVSNATQTYFFISPTVSVTVASVSQKIFVHANKAMGSTAAGGAANLDIWICYQAGTAGAVPSSVGGGILDLRVAQNTRMPIGLSAEITGLPAGAYQVGMCGFTDATNAPLWNNNEWGYVTAFVHN